MYTSINRDSAQQERVRQRESQSRDEIQAQIGDLQAKKQVLKALKNAASSSDDLRVVLDELKTNLTKSDTTLAEFASNTEQLRQSCLTSRIRAKATGKSVQTSECQQYEAMTGSASDKLAGNSDLFACVQDLDFQVNGVNQTKAALQVVIDEIDDKISELQLLLLRASTKFPSLARHAADSQDQLDSRWLRFSFDSKKKIASQDRRSSYFNTASSFSASGFFWSVGASASYSTSRSQFRRSMNSAEVKIQGELLRVTIQRPWFRPSLFKSKQFQVRVSCIYLIKFAHRVIFQ